MTALLESPAGAPAKELEFLEAVVELDGMTVWREVHPESGATIAELVAAMKDDDDFLNPLCDHGHFLRREGNKVILLGFWTTSQSDDFLRGDITEVTARFDDETSEEIAV